jgi:hypothetical protein
MSKTHVVLVREPPPQFEELSAEAGLKFFREFACWKIKEKRRKTVEDMQEVQMADVTSGDLLARMQKLTRGVFEVVDELPEGVSRDRVKVELQVPLTPIVTKTPKSSKKIGEKSGATAGVRLDFTEKMGPRPRRETSFL